MLSHGGQLLAHVVQEPVELRVHAGRIGLVIDRVQHGFHGRPHVLRGDAHQVRRVMGAAALPRRSGQVRRDGVLESGVGVRSDQPDPGQAAGDQVGEELVPRRPGLRGGDPQAQDLAVAVSVDPGGQQHHGVDHAPALADLHAQRIGGHERERAGHPERAVAEGLDLLVELGGHPGDLGLGQGVDAQSLDQLVHPSGRDPGEVAVSDHGDQRRLRSLPAFK
ncbi:Uncharacterised protein [Streptococcus pneumoniae]|nr:Uncharacterised protein [Streptococcus pneumoniae]